jgi:hypothetical protein
MANILSMNLKGGCAKTAIASITAGYLHNSMLIEMDTINQSDKKINSKDYYESIQMDFLTELDEQFFKFERILRKSDKNIIIDVGANKLSTFHKSMVTNDLYQYIDLFLIPCMDGSDDFNVAMDFLESIKDHVDLENKVIFVFNRFNEYEYSSVENQFDQFFDNAKIIQKKYKVDLCNESNYFAIKDSLAIKYARRNAITIKELCDTNLDSINQKIDEITNEQDDELMKLIKKRNIVKSALNLQKNYILPAIQKIINKLK